MSTSGAGVAADCGFRVGSGVVGLGAGYVAEEEGLGGGGLRYPVPDFFLGERAFRLG